MDLFKMITDGVGPASGMLQDVVQRHSNGYFSSKETARQLVMLVPEPLRNVVVSHGGAHGFVKALKKIGMNIPKDLEDEITAVISGIAAGAFDAANDDSWNDAVDGSVASKKLIKIRSTAGDPKGVRHPGLAKVHMPLVDHDNHIVYDENGSAYGDCAFARDFRDKHRLEHGPRTEMRLQGKGRDAKKVPVQIPGTSLPFEIVDLMQVDQSELCKECWSEEAVRPKKALAFWDKASDDLVNIFNWAAPAAKIREDMERLESIEDAALRPLELKAKELVEKRKKQKVLTEKDRQEFMKVLDALLKKEISLETRIRSAIKELVGKIRGLPKWARVLVYCWAAIVVLSVFVLAGTYFWPTSDAKMLGGFAAWGSSFIVLITIILVTPLAQLIGAIADALPGINVKQEGLKHVGRRVSGIFCSVGFWLGCLHAVGAHPHYRYWLFPAWLSAIVFIFGMKNLGKFKTVDTMLARGYWVNLIFMMTIFVVILGRLLFLNQELDMSDATHELAVEWQEKGEPDFFILGPQNVRYPVERAVSERLVREEKLSKVDDAPQRVRIPAKVYWEKGRFVAPYFLRAAESARVEKAVKAHLAKAQGLESGEEPKIEDGNVYKVPVWARVVFETPRELIIVTNTGEELLAREALGPYHYRRIASDAEGLANGEKMPVALPVSMEAPMIPGYYLAPRERENAMGQAYNQFVMKRASYEPGVKWYEQYTDKVELSDDTKRFGLALLAFLILLGGAVLIWPVQSNPYIEVRGRGLRALFSILLAAAALSVPVYAIWFYEPPKVAKKTTVAIADKPKDKDSSPSAPKGQKKGDRAKVKIHTPEGTLEAEAAIDPNDPDKVTFKAKAPGLTIEGKGSRKVLEGMGRVSIGHKSPSAPPSGNVAVLPKRDPCRGLSPRLARDIGCPMR